MRRWRSARPGRNEPIGELFGTRLQTPNLSHNSSSFVGSAILSVRWPKRKNRHMWRDEGLRLPARPRRRRSWQADARSRGRGAPSPGAEGALGINHIAFRSPDTRPGRGGARDGLRDLLSPRRVRRSLALGWRRLTRVLAPGRSGQGRDADPYISRRPASARPSVTSSAYSRSLPTGRPLASRVTRARPRSRSAM
jgi:hypothetical protein